MKANKAMVNFILLFLSVYLGLVWESVDRHSLRYLIYMLLNVVIIFSLIMFNKDLIFGFILSVKDKLSGKIKDIHPKKEDEIKKFIE
jgi:dolichyl-phosphate-mannose--protein O-mannosyl transferase